MKRTYLILCCVLCKWLPLSSIGVIPSTDFLKSSGVPLSSRGDVVVDNVSDAI